MGLITDVEVAEELLTFFGTWKDERSGTFTVEGRQIHEDKFFDDFVRIGVFLADRDAVVAGLKELETLMVGGIRLDMKVIAPGYTGGESHQHPTELFRKYYTYFYKHEGKLPEAGKVEFGGMLDKALSTIELAHGIDGEQALLSTNIDAFDFQRQLIVNRRPFKDPGAAAEHGEYTHRIQWAVICLSKILKGSPGQVYSQVGKWIFTGSGDDPHTRQKSSGRVVAMWDALVDRFGGSTNPFPDRGAEDFRNPNKFNPWMTRPENEKIIPLLHAYLAARQRKRESRYNIHDYLAVKLCHEKDYASLFKRYMKDARDRDAEEKMRLIHDNTDGLLPSRDPEEFPHMTGVRGGILNRSDLRRKH